MVSEKPPRRSKTAKDPVTIDLTAEETAAVAEPVRANDTDEPPLTAPENTETFTAAEKPVEQPAGQLADQPVEQSVEAVIDEHLAAEAEPKPEVAAEAEPAPTPAFDGPEPETTATDETTSTFAEKPTETESFASAYPETASEPAAKQKTSPATATLIAAGIFGGIVALALAGSMQYAGYLPGTSPTQTAADTTDLPSEIEALRQQVQTLSNAPPAAADTGDLAGRVEALETAAGSGDMTQRIAALEAQIGSATSTNTALEQRLAAAEAKLNETGPEQEVARAIAAAGLKAAIDRGGPFVTELETFATVASDDPALAELQAFGPTGVPSRNELQRQFPDVANAMLEAIYQPDPQQGIGSRLLESAMSVVKVRRVGNVEGDTPEATIARLEEGLRSGDLQAAVREWDALPEPAKAASQAFKASLDARIRVENLVGGTLTRAVSSTNTGN